MPDLVQQLRASATQARAIDRSELLHQAATEIARLRGEVALWKAAATLTPYEADTLGQAVTLAAGSRLGDRLRWLLERLTDCKDSMPAP